MKTAIQGNDEEGCVLFEFGACHDNVNDKEGYLKDLFELGACHSFTAGVDCFIVHASK